MALFLPRNILPDTEVMKRKSVTLQDPYAI
jgi:hypothetical protein